MNPYAATAAEDGYISIAKFRPVYDPNLVSTTGVALSLMGYTTLAGGLFGAGVIAVVTVFEALRGDPSAILGGVLFGVFAFVIGAFFGFGGALVGAPIGLLSTYPLRNVSGGWTPSALRVSHWLCGGLSGGLSGGFLLPTSFWSVVLPVICGACVVGWAGERKARLARTVLDQHSGQISD